ncbi:MAG TPA: GMC family oxidoreductase [Porticoccaceae bacterium]|nr:GMC family oxidoreductase [Porticoccaceae bacterium]
MTASSSQGPNVIVVGSGFGGAVCAARLAEAGYTVTVLERGPWRDTVPVRSMGIERRTPFPRGRQLFTRALRGIGGNRFPGGKLRLNKYGLFELFFGSGTRIVCSSGVGGGSHVYSASHVRPLVENYWQGHNPDISDAVMAHHYDSVLARLGSVTPTAELGIPNTSAARFKNSEHLEAAAPPPDPRLGYLLPKDPANPQKITDANGIERCEVDYNANDEGFLGSPGGGKTTLDFAYLAPAMQQAGLVVKDMCEVTAVIRQFYGSARYRVEFTDHHGGGKSALEADHVILAAGTLNTLRILFHSRDKRGGLVGMPQLGHRYGTNGDYLGYWDYNEPGLDQTCGLPTTGGVKLRGDDNSPMIGGGGFPSVDSYPLPKKLRARIKRGAFIAGLGEDIMNGQVSMGAGKLRVDYPFSLSSIFARTQATFDEIGKRTGRKIYAYKTPLTVHPSGGACLGSSVEDGVIGANGEIFDNPGLYVADAAALPRSPGGPPSITIAAWAEHIASQFAKET